MVITTWLYTLLHSGSNSSHVEGQVELKEWLNNMENKPKPNKNTLEENEIISERRLSKILLLYKYWNTLIFLEIFYIVEMKM